MRTPNPRRQLASGRTGHHIMETLPINCRWQTQYGTRRDTIVLQVSSFTAADNAEVLCSQDHFQTMVMRAKEFLTGKRKVRGGREFRVHLDPVIKQPPPTTTEASVLKKGKGKVSLASPHPVTVL